VVTKGLNSNLDGIWYEIMCLERQTTYKITPVAFSGDFLLSITLIILVTLITPLTTLITLLTLCRAGLVQGESVGQHDHAITKKIYVTEWVATTNATKSVDNSGCCTLALYGNTTEAVALKLVNL
jgi:hypothetical protein